MPTNYVAAVDSIYQLFYNKWTDGRVASLVGKQVAVVWKNVELDAKPNSQDFWVRLSQQTVGDGQAGLGDHNGSRRFTAFGLVFVQLFCPKSNPKSDLIGRQLSVIARDTFRFTSEDGCIWFRNSKIVELPEERDTIRFNVIAEYEYDEIFPIGT